ncbi:MAG: hypothetical protein ACOX1A_05765 [Saccharofermentanales bacterium]
MITADSLILQDSMNVKTVKTSVLFSTFSQGTSGFLVSAGEYLKEHYLEEIFYDRQAKAHYDNAMLTGYDMDRTMLRIGAMSINRNAVGVK